MGKNTVTFNLKYKLYRIADRLYCVEINNPYDLANLFVRYQEYYESPNPNIRKKSFDLDEYKRWYAITEQQREIPQTKYTFSYSLDFVGFNVPSWAINDIIWKGIYIGKLNMYDNLMKDICREIIDDVSSSLRPEYDNDKSFYLIGTPKMKSDIMQHEIAHGLYHLNDKYRWGMKSLIKSHFTKDELRKFKAILKKYHYCNDVMLDEIQAYMATGLLDDIEVFQSKTKAFENFFNTYYKDIKPKLIC